MLKQLQHAVVAVLSALLLMCPVALAQTNVTIQGAVRDAQSGDGLPGANILLVGTSIGGATDINGRYLIRNVPPGTYTLRATYVGYRAESVPVQAEEGATITHEFRLQAVGVEGETIVVTAQALGQNEAINQQLSAPSIVNVVSSARIQELPDANAAESVGRLPGVSVLRDGGEGYKVVVRGLSPQYNTITIDGVRMTSTDPDNRSVDLSMISPNMLEGIEVMKAITPDQDADALGGSVNFKVREAPLGQERLGFDLLAQGGYNKLKNTYNDYKFVGSVDGRFLDQRLGVFAQADVERRDRSDDVLGAGYTVNNPKLGQYNQPLISSVNITENTRDRKRAGGTLVVDYILPEGKISFTNFFSAGDTRQQARGEQYVVGADKNYTVVDTRTKLNVLTNILNFEQTLGFLKMDAKLSHSYSESKLPSSLNITFNEPTSLSNADPRAAPSAIPAYAKNNLNLTVLYSVGDFNQASEDRDYTGAVNFQFDANISDQITNTIKFGGKLRYKKRSFDYNMNRGLFYLGAAQDARQKILDTFPWMKQMIPGIDGSANMPITLFADPNYKYAPFFGGEYRFGIPIDIDLMWKVMELFKANTNSVAYPHDDYASTTSDYAGNETGSAGYLMAEMHIGPQITVIPGFRYERLATSYTAPRGYFRTGQEYYYPHIDTTINRVHDRLLPMIHLRYKPLSWFDVRFAYTQTLTYPNFSAITPEIYIGSVSVVWHNVDLKPARSQNFDMYASLYDNSIGLFTVGAFMKRIDNLIFYATNRIILDPNMYQGVGSAQLNYPLSTYINNPNPVNLWGLEFDWQTHFWYLPSPFKGLVLNVNYTHVYSEAKYPQTIVNTTYIPKFTKTIVDTFYTARMVNQPNNVVNLALGYDYAGFSARVSMLYSSDVFNTPNFWPDLDQNTSEYIRWDLSVKQEMPWFGLQLFFNLNNINGRHDQVVVQGSKFPSSEEDYGMTADLGLRWRY
jgi:outer membrane receptor for ferrienterochelin and colicin